tara:strand:- start:2184 stop:3206 length:1023 start_codon:yes stop_codon:yes gene_type:complete
MKKRAKNPQIFECINCNFTCSKNSEFERHKLTAKHQRLNNPNKKTPTLYSCVCGKQYKHQSTLCAHKKICEGWRFFLKNPNRKTPLVNSSRENVSKTQLYDNNDNNISEDDISEISEESHTNTDLIVSLLRQNNEFKSFMIDQCNNMQQQTQNLQKQLIEVVKDGKIINNNTTNNNNQKFNLNFFLNTTCKDAMNMSEFIENMNIDLKDIENIGKQGYVTGMTDMILSRIKDLDVTKRPLHCTDLKRETMYIKDNDEWSKDTPTNSKLHNMISIVAKQNYRRLPVWREENPECLDGNHPQYSFCLDMMKNILGDVGDGQIRLDNKIIKNLSRHILVDKNV